MDPGQVRYRPRLQSRHRISGEAGPGGTGGIRYPGRSTGDDVQGDRSDRRRIGRSDSPHTHEQAQVQAESPPVKTVLIQDETRYGRTLAGGCGHNVAAGSDVHQGICHIFATFWRGFL